MSTDARLRKADKLAKAGDRAGAAAIYREILAKFPANAKAKAGLAQVESGLGAGASVASQVAQINGLMTAARTGEAQAAARALARSRSRDVQAQVLLAQVEAAAGDERAAVAAWDAARKLAPGDLRLTLAHANALIAAGEHARAARLAGQVRAQAPALLDAALIEARALAESGAEEEALARLAPHAESAKSNLNYHLVHGNILSKIGRRGGAVAAFEAAVALAPNDLGALNNLSNELAKLERFRDAITLIESALERAPGHVLLRQNLAQTLQNAAQNRRALEVLEGLLEETPGSVPLRGQIALCHAELGNTARTREILDGLRAEDPDSFQALLFYAGMFPLDPGSADFARLEAALEDDTLTPRNRIMILNALFVALDHAGETDRAFVMLKASRDLREQNAPFDMAGLRAVMSALPEAFAPPAPILEGDAPPLPARPVFVVGMPRSGTTLVEQILAGHPEVHAAGELLALFQAASKTGWHISEPGAPLTREALLELRASYGEQIAQLDHDRPVITDKAPLNFLWAGHALAAMPEARVLILDRDPMAVCWSNYSRHLVGTANNFANDLDNLAETYRGFARLRDLWAARYPDRVHVVDYAALTEDPEAGARAVVAAAGLDWDPACLDIGARERAVRTASAGQAQGAIYKGSDAAWRRYAPHLAPLEAALGDLGPARPGVTS